MGKGEIACYEQFLLFPLCFQKQSVVNSFPNKPWFLCDCSTSLLKTLWEKEKLLVTSNFPFSHSVFYPFVELSAISFKFEIVVCKLFQFGSVQTVSFGKGLMRQNGYLWSKGLKQLQEKMHSCTGHYSTTEIQIINDPELK